MVLLIRGRGLLECKAGALSSGGFHNDIMFALTKAFLSNIILQEKLTMDTDSGFI